MTKPRLWKKGDRLVHRQTGQSAIVTHFIENALVPSGYFATIQEADGAIAYGDWGEAKQFWRVSTGFPSKGATRKVTINLPVELLEKIKGRGTTKAIVEALEQYLD